MSCLADLDIRWLEEPVSSDDLAGLALVRSRSAADVAAGQYGPDVTYFRRMCAAGALDCLQVDATRAGGYTGWFRAAAVAAAYNIEVSAHCGRTSTPLPPRRRRTCDTWSGSTTTSASRPSSWRADSIRPAG